MNYESTTTKSILDQIARLRGWDPSAAPVAQGELERMAQLSSGALEFAWTHAPWPQLLVTRRVQYRPDWTPREYYEGDQVLHRGRYWEAVGDTAADEEPGAAAEAWTPCDGSMLASIDYNELGIDEVDLQRGVFALNPDTRADARPLPCARTASGLCVLRAPGAPTPPARPFVRFRPLPPRLSATPWSATAPYGAGDTVYHAGRSWAALRPGAGDEPGLDDAAWAEQAPPRLFEQFVVAKAAAELVADAETRTADLRRAGEILAHLTETMFRQINPPGRALTRVFR